MWRSFHSGQALGIAHGALAVADKDAIAVRHHGFVTPEAGANANKFAPAIHTLDLAAAIARTTSMQGQPTRTARIVVGNDLARHWLLDPPKGAASLREIQAVAQARFAELFAEPIDDWLVAGDWRTKHPFVCVALPKWVVAATRGTDLGTLRATLVTSALGRALELFRRKLPNTGWCCVRTPRSLALMYLRGGLPVTLRVAPAVPGSAHDDLISSGTQELQREAARHAVEPVVSATWLDLSLHDLEPTSRTLDRAGVSYRILGLGRQHLPSDQVSASTAEATVAAILGAMSERSTA